jgi:bifunctional UDP-N-acetylglucosamine pyrophosphorylase/glucosamine-1-phosphate N-acetyltransferase
MARKRVVRDKQLRERSPTLYDEYVKVPSVVIMAAGRGTRMRSRLPKVLHPLCGRPLLLWPVEAAREAGAERIVVVLGLDHEEIRRVLPPGVEVAVQREPLGTGDAVMSARNHLKGSDDVIVLPGDHPLLDASFVSRLGQHHRDTGAAATVATQELENPGQYGRIVRGPDGDLERIVEAKGPGDATDEELAIKEINLCTYAFQTGPLLEALGHVRTDNAQGELYLGDVLPIMRASGHKLSAFSSEDGGAGPFAASASSGSSRITCSRG